MSKLSRITVSSALAAALIAAAGPAAADRDGRHFNGARPAVTAPAYQGWRGHPGPAFHGPRFAQHPGYYAQPAPVYYQQPVYGGYYGQPMVYSGRDVNPAGAIVGAVAGGMIGNAASNGSHGATALGAIIGGLIGSGF